MNEPGSRRPLYHGVAGGIIAILLIGGLAWIRLFEPIDHQVYDFLLDVRSELRDTSSVRSRIVLVLIDEETQSELGIAWPWPRSLYADLLAAVDGGGATAIGFDMLFLDRTDPGEDERFASALQEYPNVVLGAKLDATDRRVAGGAAELQQMRLLLPLFRDRARVALVNLPFDRDHVVRRFKPRLEIFGDDHYALAMELHRMHTGSYPLLRLDAEHGIDYVGGGGSFASVSATDVLSGNALLSEPGLFEGKIVLIGVTLTEAKEFFATPLAKGDELCAGVEIHANVLASLLNGRYCRDMARQAQALLAMVIAAIAAYLAMFRSGLAVVIGYGCMAVGIMVVAIWLMVYHGVSVDMSYGMVAMPLGYILAGLPARQPMVLHTQVGPYQLIRELGHGGMAVVYLARHPRTKEVVALKQMLPHYAADEQAVQRFLREMDLLRELNHPNIVRIIDAGEVSGQPYYAMEYISGKSLGEVLEEQHRMTQQEVVRTCEGIAWALYQAHQLGVVHRDLKPSNIMLTATAIPKLTDFGIASKTDAPHLTQAGMLVGTPQYMSPEQIRCQAITPKSDIYSFGATLYHLLSGRPPFSWPEVPRILHGHLEEEASPISDRHPDLDPALADLVMGCLRKDPRDRPRDMAEVATVLAACQTSAIASRQAATGLHTRVHDAMPERTQLLQAPEPRTEPWQRQPTRRLDTDIEPPTGKDDTA